MSELGPRRDDNTPSLEIPGNPEDFSCAFCDALNQLQESMKKFVDEKDVDIDELPIEDREVLIDIAGRRVAEDALERGALLDGVRVQVGGAGGGVVSQNDRVVGLRRLLDGEMFIGTTVGFGAGQVPTFDHLMRATEGSMSMEGNSTISAFMFVQVTHARFILQPGGEPVEGEVGDFRVAIPLAYYMPTVATIEFER